MTPTIDVKAAREALAELPDGASDGSLTALAQVYAPPAHLKALHPDTLLVTGMRGAGKTFWCNALRNPAVRSLVGQQAFRFPMSETTEVLTGFGVEPAPDRYPSKDVLRKLMVSRVEPRSIWRTVQAWQLAGDEHALRKRTTWPERVAFVDGNPEAIDRLFHERDEECERRDAYLLMLFDALDRCADDWKEMDRAIRGLLQTALDMRAHRRLRVKVFLRSDQVEENRIADFPDAYRVVASAVELSWPRRELYGLLWRLLANGRHGERFRAFLTPHDWTVSRVGDQPVFSAPRSMIREEDDQQGKFHAIAGSWMGYGPKLLSPYTWIPNHLADAEGRVSPRSFLAALRTAAEDTGAAHPEHPFALHHDSIKRGVRDATRIRISEIREDFPWIHRAMTPLAGMYVPCEFEEIAERWRSEGVPERLTSATGHDKVKLPSRHVEQGPDGVRIDLEALGVFLRLRDGRVNIPDVFRVGYGLGRRGGVRPIRER